MKNSILIIGQQCTGKTNKLNELLIKSSRPFSVCEFKNFKVSDKETLVGKTIGIDDKISETQLKYILKTQKEFDINFVIACSSILNALPFKLTSQFELIEMSGVFKTDR